MPRDVDPSSLDEENGLWNEGPGGFCLEQLKVPTREMHTSENFAAQFRKVVLEVLTHRVPR